VLLAVGSAGEVDELLFGTGPDRDQLRAQLQAIAGRKQRARSIDPATLPPLRD
jgi:hypothetical protein